MVLTLMVSLLASAPPEAIRSDDPPIKVSLNQDNYFVRGDRARAKIRTAEDGYVVVVRADAQGRVRVLFPLDPTDDDFVRGGHTDEVRGRGDREAFYVDDSDGARLVLAARTGVRATKRAACRPPAPGVRAAVREAVRYSMHAPPERRR